MQLVFADQALPFSVTKSLFLAGPSPRTLVEVDWRHEAVRIMEELGYDGTVFIPVPSYRFHEGIQDKGTEGWSYDSQVEWEVAARKMADVILFWVPRVIDRSKKDLGMPAFTTNFELGEDLHSGKLAYGRPDDAQKCRYLDQRVLAAGLSVHNALRGLLSDVVLTLGAGALRNGGEAQVPLFIWLSEAFQGWYANLKAAGNRLDGADLLNSVKLGGKHLFSFMLHVKVWVAAEKRHKSNEVVFARKDVSAVVALHRKGSTTHVALVREFRSTVNNPEGYVYELASGSSDKAGVGTLVGAQHELQEELGLTIADARRFSFVGIRQLAATLSTHRAQVYAVHLTDAEFAQLKTAAENGKPLGNGTDSERTFVEIATLDTLFELPVDYSMLGMIYEATRGLS